VSKVKEGEKAPLFKAPASNGKIISLKDYLGKKNVVLYFYPKDDTPGCTVEACGFRDKIKLIEAKEAVVLGVSPDNISSHEKFINKFKLPFLLLSDKDKRICKAYGVWVKKNMYGRQYMGVARTTFIIGKDGKVKRLYPKVKPEVHSDEIVSFLST